MACSACGSGITALTALGGPLTPWELLHWICTGISTSIRGEIGSAPCRTWQEQKFLFWRQAGAEFVWYCSSVVSRSEKLLGAGEVPAVQHVVLGLLVLLPGSGYNLLAKATSLPAPNRQRAVCHLQSPPDS